MILDTYSQIQLTFRRLDRVCSGVVRWSSLISVLVGLASCATTIEPPRSVYRGSYVALIDHGRHSSLILPGLNEEMIRYSYGDWEYYALAKTGPFKGSAALFWPTQAALGRRILTGPISIGNIRRQVEIGDEIFLIWVEVGRIEGLRIQLEEIFRSNQGSLIYNPRYDLEFVHHPEDYWIFHNSNQVIGDWLQQLGCRLHGLALVSVWKLQVQ